MLNMLVAFFVVICVAVVSIVSSEVDNKITIEDINVGDKLRIKGEKFTVLGYGENGLMEVEDYTRKKIR